MSTTFDPSWQGYDATLQHKQHRQQTERSVQSQGTDGDSDHDSMDMHAPKVGPLIWVLFYARSSGRPSLTLRTV